MALVDREGLEPVRSVSKGQNARWNFAGCFDYLSGDQEDRDQVDLLQEYVEDLRSPFCGCGC